MTVMSMKLLSSLVSVWFVAGTIVGCMHRSDARTPVGVGEFEILSNPQILADFAVPIEKMTLKGVALGEGREAILSNRVLSEDANGWIVCRDACRYRIIAGKVATLGVWDQKALTQLGVNEEADIQARFGPPESVEKVDTLSTKMTIHRFANGTRRASWDRILNRLSTVNIGSAAVAATEP